MGALRKIPFHGRSRYGYFLEVHILNLLALYFFHNWGANRTNINTELKCN